MNSRFDKVRQIVKDDGMNATEDTVKQVRDLKAQGLSWREVAEKLNMSKQSAHYHGRPRPGEHICSSCLRPLKRAKV